MIYNGVPVGKYKTPIVQAYVQALDTVLSQGLEPAPVSIAESEGGLSP